MSDHSITLLDSIHTTPAASFRIDHPSLRESQDTQIIHIV